MIKLSIQAKGLILTTAGVLALCPDTLLVRLLDIDRWALLVYRGLMIAVGLTLITLLTHGRSTGQQFRKIGWPGLGVSLLFAVSTVSFVTSLYFTTVANTLIIISSSSMFAALYSRLFLKENIYRRTIIAMMIVIGAIGYIVSDGLGGGSLKGDAIALLSSMSIAGAFTLTRHARGCDMIPATAVSGLLVAVFAYYYADFVPLESVKLIQLILLGLCLTIAFGLLTVGPRYISAPEVSLLMPIETVLGPVLIWFVIGEQPSVTTLLGGAVVISTLTIHSLLNLRDKAKSLG